MGEPALIAEISNINFDDHYHCAKVRFSLDYASMKPCCYQNFRSACVAGEFDAKRMDGDATPSYTRIFSKRRRDDMQLMQKLQLVNKGNL